VKVGDSYIRATSLIGFAELAEKFGGNAAELLEAAGIKPEALTEVDGLISYRRLAHLLELSAQRLDRPAFGLDWTLNTPAHFPNLGPLALMANFVTNFDEWIAMALKYWRYHTNGFVMELTKVPEDGTAVFRFVPDSFALPGRQIAEVVLGNICTMGRTVTGRTDVHPKLVRFQHSRPQSISTHQQVFACPIEFDADHTEILIDAAILGYATNGSLRLLKSLVGRYIKHRIDRMPVYDGTLTTTVALAIPSIIGTGRCDIEFVAAQLDLSSKTLQRKLAQEGTNFSEILDKVRENLARRLLVDSEAAVERIAGLLDYSTTAPFTAAFKRWTGETPLSFRKAERKRRADSADLKA
jgi:AraC-like DNA-binding protein